MVIDAQEVTIDIELVRNVDGEVIDRACNAGPRSVWKLYAIDQRLGARVDAIGGDLIIGERCAAQRIDDRS